MEWGSSSVAPQRVRFLRRFSCQLIRSVVVHPFFHLPLPSIQKPDSKFSVRTTGEISERPPSSRANVYNTQTTGACATREPLAVVVAARRCFRQTNYAGARGKVITGFILYDFIPIEGHNKKTYPKTARAEDTSIAPDRRRRRTERYRRRSERGTRGRADVLERTKNV